MNAGADGWLADIRTSYDAGLLAFWSLDKSVPGAVLFARRQP